MTWTTYRQGSETANASVTQRLKPKLEASPRCSPWSAPRDASDPPRSSARRGWSRALRPSEVRARGDAVAGPLEYGECAQAGGIAGGGVTMTCWHQSSSDRGRRPGRAGTAARAREPTVRCRSPPGRTRLRRAYRRRARARPVTQSDSSRRAAADHLGAGSASRAAYARASLPPHPSRARARIRASR